jgi:hypothetical protein
MDFVKLAKKIAKLLKDGEKHNLSAVMIVGEGVGYYYNLATMTFIPVQKKSEMYHLPVKADEDNNLYIFMPYTFSQGAVILVPEEEIQFIGLN